MVGVLRVESQGAPGGEAVAQGRGHAGRTAVHHAGVHVRGDGVELFPVAPPQGAAPAARCRAEEGHAALEAGAGVRGRDLGEGQEEEDEGEAPPR